MDAVAADALVAAGVARGAVLAGSGTNENYSNMAIFSQNM
jgi:hypothetical protein